MVPGINSEAYSRDKPDCVPDSVYFTECLGTVRIVVPDLEVGSSSEDETTG